MEKPQFFASGPESLFGVLHTPENSAPQAGLVICHAFGEEKLWSHRVSVNLAREAVRLGKSAFRFDLRGHGDSSGSTEDCTLESFLTDISGAIKVFREQCPSVTHVCLLGLRFGATLTSLYTSRSTEVDSVILVEPILNGSRYMQELLRINLATQLAVYGKIRLNREALVEQMQSGLPVNVDGYLISNSLYAQCTDMNLNDHDGSHHASGALVMQIATTNSQKDNVDLKAFADSLPKADFQKVIEVPFWREIKPYTSRTRNVVRESIGWWETCLEY